MSIVISVENVSKAYRLGMIGGATLKEDVARWWAKVRGKPDPLLKVGEEHHAGRTGEQFWALENVSFEVKEGEVIGIIGRNGAGKSTLLKILSQVTAPTSGQVKVKGRIASLLEVGTGFHPELTGRENIFLNGAILGMTKAEIRRNFEEIVAFSEIEEFIDTPVKRYSSGMYVRLAFAVAAHLEPEILIVDEVLAVGDAEFQAKCLRKMQNVSSSEGRTILFVSHNLAAVLRLCPSAILLDSGSIIGSGATGKVVDQYIQTVSKISSQSLDERTDRKGNQILKFVGFEIRNSHGVPIRQACSGEDVIIALKYHSHNNTALRKVSVAIGIHNKFDEKIFHLSTDVYGFDFEKIPPTGTILCHVPSLPLQPGSYSFNLFCSLAGTMADWVTNSGMIEVGAGNFFGSGKLPPLDQGVFLVKHSWSVDSTESLCCQ